VDGELMNVDTNYLNKGMKKIIKYCILSNVEALPGWPVFRYRPIIVHVVRLPAILLTIETFASFHKSSLLQFSRHQMSRTSFCIIK